MKIAKIIFIVILGVVGAGLVGCGPKDDTAGAAGTTAPAKSNPPNAMAAAKQGAATHADAAAAPPGTPTGTP